MEVAAKQFKPLKCRSQEAGHGNGCVFWAHLNAFEGLLRALPRSHDYKYRGGLPAVWRRWYSALLRGEDIYGEPHGAVGVSSKMPVSYC